MMQKIRVVIRASMRAAHDTTRDYERRTRWDTSFYDFRVLYQSQDKSYRRIYYAFKSPSAVSDRDFYLDEHYRRDFPEPGMYTTFIESLPPNEVEMPEQRNHVRAKFLLTGFVLKPYFD